MFNYKSLLPTNQKSSYTEFDSIDFLLTGSANESIVCNSVRIEGVLSIETGNGIPTNDDKVYFDSLTGINGVVESITVETQNKGVLENLSSYPRFVKMLRTGSMTSSDTMNGSYVCELCCPNDYLSKQVLQGVLPVNTALDGLVNNTITATPQDFSFKPECCLNRAMSESGEPLVSFDDVGYIKVNIKLARVFEFLYGESVDNNYNYTITDLRMTYRTVMRKPSGKVTMRTTSTFKSSAQSSLTNVSARLPAVCDSMVISFIQQNREQTPQYNNLQLEEIKNIDYVDYVYNDSTNSIITYQIKDRIELLDRAMEALRNTGKNNASITKLKANESFMLGLNFGQFIDFTNQKLSLNLSSQAVSNTDSYSMYFYFNGVQEL